MKFIKEDEIYGDEIYGGTWINGTLNTTKLAEIIKPPDSEYIGYVTKKDDDSLKYKTGMEYIPNQKNKNTIIKWENGFSVKTFEKDDEGLFKDKNRKPLLSHGGKKRKSKRKHLLLNRRRTHRKSRK